MESILNAEPNTRQKQITAAYSIQLTNVCYETARCVLLWHVVSKTKPCMHEYTGLHALMFMHILMCHVDGCKCIYTYIHAVVLLS